jgi:hypothetical protein
LDDWAPSASARRISDRASILKSSASGGHEPATRLVADDLGLRAIPGAVQCPLSPLFGITRPRSRRLRFRLPPVAGVGRRIHAAEWGTLTRRAVAHVNPLPA